MTIEFKSPPPDGRGGSLADWSEVARQLKERPGEWAIVAQGVSATLAQAIKRADRAAFAPAGTFEAVSRVSSTGRKRDIYARYVGEGEVTR